MGLGGAVWWLIGAIVIFSVIPFTLLVIKPTNKQLLVPDRNLSSAETRILLERWGKLHAVRSLISVFASVIFLALLT